MPSSQGALWSRLKPAIQTVGAGNVVRVAFYARLKRMLDARCPAPGKAGEGRFRGVLVPGVVTWSVRGLAGLVEAMAADFTGLDWLIDCRC